MTSKVIKGHKRPRLCQNLSSTFVYVLIWMKICRNANIMKTQFFHKIISDMKCHSYFMENSSIFLFLNLCLFFRNINNNLFCCIFSWLPSCHNILWMEKGKENKVRFYIFPTLRQLSLLTSLLHFCIRFMLMVSFLYCLKLLLFQ